MLSSSGSTQIANIHSKQPWIVLSSEQYSTSLTAESPLVSHYYSFKAGASDNPMAVPDGCIDLLFDCDANQPTGMVYGTALEAKELNFHSGHRYFGIRFLPGVMPEFLDISAPEITDQQIDILDVVPNGQSLFEQIVMSPDFGQQVSIANRFMRDKAGRTPSNLTNQIIDKICHDKGNVQVKELETYTGYCSRTLQRQFHSDIGLSPKAFCRAIRCQSAIYGINHSDKLAFTDLAFDLGFSDQSHFLREFKKLVSTTPLDYQNRVKQKTYLERIKCY